MLVSQRILPLTECPKHQVNRILIKHTDYMLIVYAHLLDVYVLLYFTQLYPLLEVLISFSGVCSKSGALFRWLFLDLNFWVSTIWLLCITSALSAWQSWADILLVFCMTPLCLSYILYLLLQGCAVLLYCPYHPAPNKEVEGKLKSLQFQRTFFLDWKVEL